MGKSCSASDEQGLVGLWLDTDRYYGDILAKTILEGENEYLSSAKKMVKYLFSRKEPNFFLNYTLTGTDFRKRVWQALLKNSLWEQLNLQISLCKLAQDKEHLPIRATGGSCWLEIISALLFLAIELLALNP